VVEEAGGDVVDGTVVGRGEGEHAVAIRTRMRGITRSISVEGTGRNLPGMFTTGAGATHGEFEAVLRRVAHGARLLGLGWWALLGMLVLADQPNVVRWPVIASVIVAIAWASAATVRYRKDPFSTTAAASIALDLGAAVLAVVAPALAGTGTLFYGGFPFIVVVVASIRSARAGWASGATLSAIVVVQLLISESSADDFAFPVSQVLVYLAGAFITTWAVGVLRRSDAEMIAAREALARAEERADISRHLHDSVLQNLALIQKAADRPAEVVTLARRQERELREWLYGGASPSAGSLGELMRRIGADVEERYGVPTDVVSVGDVGAGGPVVEALLGAAREAMVNAAKHSEADRVSVYVEAADGRVRVYVRDRGTGFDPGSAAADRHGISESIVGRLEKVGGSATVRTQPGKGAEWLLEVHL
jgi:signal transduction histidine kinase